IWETLQNLNAKLATTRPKLDRLFAPIDGDFSAEPLWVASAVASGVWDRISRGERRTVVHIAMLEPRPKPSRVRLALVMNGSASSAPDVEFIGLEGSVVKTATPLKHNIAWRIALPSPESDTAM